MWKNDSKKDLPALPPHKFFFTFISLISNHMVFLVQFGINMHLWVLQKAEIALVKVGHAISAFGKTCLCKLIPNWTRNCMITYTYKFLLYSASLSVLLKISFAMWLCIYFYSCFYVYIFDIVLFVAFKHWLYAVEPIKYMYTCMYWMHDWCVLFCCLCCSEDVDVDALRGNSCIS